MKQKCVSGALLVKEMKFFFQTPFLRASPTTWRSGCHILDYMRVAVAWAKKIFLSHMLLV